MNTKMETTQNEGQLQLPDLTNPEAARQAVLAAEILNRKY